MTSEIRRQAELQPASALAEGRGIFSMPHSESVTRNMTQHADDVAVCEVLLGRFRVASIRASFGVMLTMTGWLAC